jgi:hypothetical protein
MCSRVQAVGGSQFVVGGNQAIWRVAAAKQAPPRQLGLAGDRTAAAARQIASKLAPTWI